jgi:NAD(P) transhydrogenase subunit alpha
MDFISILSIFVLACFVGYYVVWSVTPALHTPLMAVTNAISSVIIVGALIASGRRRVARRPSGWACSRVVLASVNIFGGFAVTARMLAMYKKKERSDGTRAAQLPWAMLAYLVRACCSSSRCAGCVSGDQRRAGNRFGMAGMLIAVVTTLVTHADEVAVLPRTASARSGDARRRRHRARCGHRPSRGASR